MMYSCKSAQVVSSDCHLGKVDFDLTELNEKGRNKITGQSITYEFCIPDNETVIAEVMEISKHIVRQGGKGKSKCSDGQLLMRGDTDHETYRGILCKIVKLDYVKKVRQTYWE